MLKSKNAESVCHDFVYALSLAGMPLSAATGPLGQCFRKWTPAARNMIKTKTNLRDKYMHENYVKHIDCIKEKINNQMFSLVFDESPDIMGRKTVNTLIAFYDRKSKTKSILLIDCSFLKSCDHNSLITLTNNILETFEKKWTDVLALSTDSASYAIKYSQLIRERHNDISHLIHVAVIKGFKSDELRFIREIIISFGNLFVNASKLNEAFYELLETNGLKAKKPNQVVEHRWFSYFKTSQDIIELWSYLIEFVDYNSSKKITSIKTLLGDQLDQMLIFITINGIIDILTPIEALQRTLETNKPISHKIYGILKQLSQSFKHFSLTDKVKNLLNGITVTNRNKVELLLTAFHNEIKNKWLATYNRNLNDDCFGDNGLLKKIQVFDPFNKCLQNQDFEYYKDLFLEASEVENIESLENEFKEYLSDSIPDNLELEVLKYWSSIGYKYPKLSKIAITFLCIPFGSYDAERSFSKLRDLNIAKRNRMNSETLKMQMLLYFNGDIEERLIHY